MINETKVKIFKIVLLWLLFLPFWFTAIPANLMMADDPSTTVRMYNYILFINLIWLLVPVTIITAIICSYKKVKYANYFPLIHIIFFFFFMLMFPLLTPLYLSGGEHKENIFDIMKDENSRCGSLGIIENPEQIPVPGCFTLGRNKTARIKVGDNVFSAVKKINGEVSYKINDLELKGSYSSNISSAESNSPFAVKENHYQWRICEDKDKINCPILIYKRYEENEKMSTSSSFEVSYCEGSMSKGWCQLGKIRNDYCKGQECFK